jgi:hypothetical protein
MKAQTNVETTCITKLGPGRDQARTYTIHQSLSPTGPGFGATPAGQNPSLGLILLLSTNKLEGPQKPDPDPSSQCSGPIRFYLNIKQSFIQLPIHTSYVHAFNQID